MAKNKNTGFTVNTNDSNTVAIKEAVAPVINKNRTLPDVLIINKRGSVIYDKIVDVSAVGDVNIDVQKFQKVIIRLTSSVNVIFNNYPPVGEALVVGITVIQNEVGGHIITFPNNVAWEDFTLPQFGQLPNYRTDFTFEFVRLNTESLITGYVISVNVGIPLGV